RSGLKRGATIGIPYAPDRLPDAADAAQAKIWAVCDRPGGGTGRGARQAVFVLGGDEDEALSGPSALTGDQVLYVQDENRNSYLVDRRGTKFPLGGAGGAPTRGQDTTGLLLRTLFGETARPQTVTGTWLASLNSGTRIGFPPIDGRGGRVPVDGVPAAKATAGTVLQATSAVGAQYYVITRKGVAPVTRFAALLLLQANAQTDPVRISIPADPLPAFIPADWPQGDPSRVNTTTGDSPRDVSCSVLHGGMTATSSPRLTVWAGKDYPEQILDGTASAYVTPGSGLLYQEVAGDDVSGGTLYLATDTGLRYAVSRNNDSAAAEKASTVRHATGQAAVRLGYADVKPLSIPSAWSELLPKGPALDTTSAARPQGS
ncbi:MAG: type VII secretion protein EccB, partial [Streptomyces sp.]|nr:type VII secretion protein EccB [Streptomyces sp.]